MEKQFKELHNKIDILMASGIAKSLKPLLITPSSATSSSLPPVINMSTPVTTTQHHHQPQAPIIRLLSA